MKIREYLKKKKSLIDRELIRLIPSARERPQIIHRAIKHSLGGGKRIRPILCLSVAEAAGANPKAALRAACAIEMVHAYSLVHDDLPSMDNDDIRRGRPTCHIKFGVANAILTGDALLTLGFNSLSGATSDSNINCRIIKELSNAIGTFGMIGGQAIDISENEKDLLTIEYVNINKTGALIASSCKIGAMIARAEEKDVRTLYRYGEYIGLVFQIVDDILDSDGFAKMVGPKRAFEHARELTQKATKSLSSFGKRSEPLCEIAEFVLNRKR
ncbi:polyprenyl synthetase family protein [Candidatus Omnitrophota bacterium]